METIFVVANVMNILKVSTSSLVPFLWRRVLNNFLQSSVSIATYQIQQFEQNSYVT